MYPKRDWSLKKTQESNTIQYHKRQDFQKKKKSIKRPTGLQTLWSSGKANETTMTPVRLVIVKEPSIAGVVRMWRTGKPLTLLLESKWCNHHGKQDEHSSEKLRWAAICSINSPFRYISKRMGTSSRKMSRSSCSLWHCLTTAKVYLFMCGLCACTHMHVEYYLAFLVNLH